MKAKLSILFTLFLFFTAMTTIIVPSTVSAQENSPADDELNYCYKPSKPLFFAKSVFKDHYAEDMKEYQRCRRSFIEMRDRVASMRQEAEKNAKLIRESFAKDNFVH